MKETEIWKKVEGYNGIYFVSNLGNVKSFANNKEKLLKGSLNGFGYYFVTLVLNKKSKVFMVHQLVAIAFLNHTPCGFKLVVNHKNFIRTDNRLENLEIVTQRENTNKKHIKSSSKYTGVHWHKRNNKWACNIRINGNRKYLGYFSSEYDAHLCYEKELKLIKIK